LQRLVIIRGASELATHGERYPLHCAEADTCTFNRTNLTTAIVNFAALP
jgi:hypothetical protein